MTDILRVRTVFTGVAGAPWYSNMYFSFLNPAADALEVVGAVGTFWTALKANILTGTVITVEGTVPVINAESGKILNEQSTPALTTTATATGDPLPFATQGLLKWQTNTFVNGRRVLGRTFIPGVMETNNFNGGPDATLTSLANNAAAALIADTGNTFVIWARPVKHNPAQSGDRDGTMCPATTGTFWSKWAVLRSRRD